MPHLTGGFKDLKVLKTTQSGFVAFHRDQYTTLNDVNDRIFCTNAYCEYQFNTVDVCLTCYDFVSPSSRALAAES